MKKVIIPIARLITIAFIAWWSVAVTALQNENKLNVKTRKEITHQTRPSSFSKRSTVNIQRWTTKAGTPVYFVQREELPILDIGVAFSAGSAFDGNQPGIANLTNTLLYSGTKTMSIDVIAKRFEKVGAEYHFSVSRDNSTLELRTLSTPKHMETALNTFSAIIGSPSFPKKEFVRVKNLTLRALEHKQQLPGSIASRQFYSSLYHSQPYSHSTIGSTHSIKKIKLKDVRRFYRQHYVAKNAIVTMVGPLSVDEAKQVAEHITSRLPSGKHTRLSKDPTPPVHTIVKRVLFPSSQTHIIIGTLGIKRNDPDYFPLTVGNSILGGIPLTSKLFSVVRGQHGLVYSIRSKFLPLTVKGPFFINLQTRNHEAAKAITLTQGVLKHFIDNGPTSDDLSLAKQVIIGQFPFSIASNLALNRSLINIAFYQLPIDYLNTYQDNIQAVTTEQIKQAFQQRLGDKKMITIIVGNLKKTNAAH